jgi:hypothetical protein
VTFDSIVQSDSSPPINERCQIKSKLLQLMLDEFGRVHERFDNMESELGPMHAELKSIRPDLDDLAEKVENVLGYRKEIDHLLERVTALEKKLTSH